jgi:hypothetical protein
METYNQCWAKRMASTFYDCGVDYKKYADISAVWRWLAQQPSFLQSDGSDHFVFAELPINYLHRFVRLPLALIGMRVP